MSGNGASYDAPQVVPGPDIWSDEYSAGSGPADGGNAAPGFVSQVTAASNALRSRDRAAALGSGEKTSGDAGWWDQSIHTAG